MDLTGFLKKKLGPLPMGAWIFIAVVVAFALVKLHGKKGAATGGSSDPTAGGQFSTSQTRTDKDGNTVTYTASGPNSSIQSPAQLTYGAGPMGYSGGDVYVNIPADPPVQVNVPPPTPQPPPPAPPPHHEHHDGHSWWDDIWDAFDIFTPVPQTTTVQTPVPTPSPGQPDNGHWEVPNYVGGHQGGYADGPGNSGDSLFNPDNVQRIFG